VFPRVVETKDGDKTYKYLRLVENKWVGGKKKQVVVAHVGRVEDCAEKVSSLIDKLRRFCSEVYLKPEEQQLVNCAEYGPIWLAEALWKELQVDKWFKEKFAQVKNLKIDAERFLFAMVSNRLSEPRSEYGLWEWRKKIYWPWDENFLSAGRRKSWAELFYRVMDNVIRWKKDLETYLYFRLRDLFSISVDIAFYDITNVQFEGEGPGIAKLGYPRHGKKNHKQVTLALLLCDGLPVGHYVFRGNHQDKTTVEAVIKDIKERYKIGRIVWVMDRGMFTVENLKFIEDIVKDGYIIALKRRRNKEVKKLVEESLEGSEEINTKLKAKEIKPRPEAIDKPDKNKDKQEKDKERLIICYNKEVAQRDRLKREGIMKIVGEELAGLATRVKEGNPKNIQPIVVEAEEILSKRKAKRYFGYKVKEKGNFEYWVKEESVAYEEKIDGKFFLRTKEKLSLKEIVEAYKNLWEIEAAFRNLKTIEEIAPVFHSADRRVRCHIFIGILAFLLEKILQKKLEACGIRKSTREALEILRRVQVGIMEIQENHQVYYLRRPDSEAQEILEAVGINHFPKILRYVNSELDGNFIGKTVRNRS